MAVKQRLRFSAADEESINATIQDFFETAKEQEGNEKPFVARDTEKERNRIWTAWVEYVAVIPLPLPKFPGIAPASTCVLIWRRYCIVVNEKTKRNCENGSQDAPKSLGVDPFRFWVDFARDPSAPMVQALVQAFLSEYVRTSTKERVVLGPEERAMVRTLNSAYSVIEIWRRLVAAADFKVLRKERKALMADEKYLEAEKLFLKWEQEGNKQEGPAYLIVRWILITLSPALNLEVNSLYVKVEATAADIIAVLSALYERAEDIPASPLTRISFHSVVLQGSTGGFRPGTLMSPLFRQYTVSIVRDPEDRTRNRIVVTPTINRNKIKTAQTTCKYRKGKTIGYSTTLVPLPVLCLASLVLTRAIQLDALDVKPRFQSVGELLQRPVLGETGRIDIPWKSEFLDQPIFPITYPVFYELWMRCLLVIGCRKAIRPYSLRVGAGARLDDSVPSALRNYVMSHSGGTFEDAYQTGIITRKNLSEVAFGPRAVGRDETLYNELRSMTLTRDEGAPISVSKEKIAEFKARNDIAGFRAEIQATSDPKEKRRLYSEIATTINTCTRLQLEEDRQAYFKKADQLRLQGIEPEPTPGAGGPGAAALVASVLSDLGPLAEGPSKDTSVSERYTDAQLSYLSAIAPSVRRQASGNAAASKSKQGASKSRQEAPEPKQDAPESKQDSCCFICSRGFNGRSSLTRHFRRGHLVDGTFDKPLACPECRRVGAAEIVVHGPTQWCNHLEHAHGKIHTPNVNPGANPGANPGDCPSSSPLSCLLCEAPMASPGALLAHMNRTEIPRYREGLRVSCGACTRDGQVDAKPMTIWEWLTHARVVHEWSLHRVESCLLCGHLCVQGSGFQRHFTTQHSDRLGKPLECAACVASALPADMRGINGLQELLAHAAEKHSSGQAPDVAAGKRKRDGDMDGADPCPPAKRQRDDDMDGGDTTPAAKRRRDDKREPSPVMIYGLGSDLENTHSHEVEPMQWTTELGSLDIVDPALRTPSDDIPMGFVDVESGAPPLEPSECGIMRDFPADLIDPALRSSTIIEDVPMDWNGSAQQNRTAPPDQSMSIELDDGLQPQPSTADSMVHDVDSGGSLVADPVYPIDCILDKWGRDLFFLRWKDGSHSWVLRKDLNEDDVARFLKSYKGLRHGVDVLDTRRRKGKIEYQVRSKFWAGDDAVAWVPASRISPELTKKHKPSKEGKKRRAKHQSK
ncbi:hypothetical protein GQ53DRAFT_147693 [Thozetella sp. PMI_491]|nr:hypothetical protein GQ53DRAFT_147693 [Thozetella sp. PMI_491]